MANILVVDDDAGVLAVISRMVAKDGHVVREATDGRTAMRLMREAPADVIITDVYMPEVDGIETLIRIQQDFPDTRVIVITGGGNMKADDILDIATSLGASAVLRKPASEEEIRAAVATALS